MHPGIAIPKILTPPTAPPLLLVELPLRTQHQILLPVLLLLLEPALVGLVLLAEHLVADREGGQHADGRDRHEEDPDVPQRFRVRLPHHRLLSVREGVDQAGRRPRVTAPERHGRLRGERRPQHVLVRGHAILEDDAADDDRDGGRQVPHEAEHGRRGGDVSRRDLGLEGDQGSLEVGAHTEARDDLEGEDAAEGAGGGDVDVEAEADGHEDHAEPYRGEVLAGFLDEDAANNGGEGERQNIREKVDPAQDRGRAKHCLEIQG